MRNIWPKILILLALGLFISIPIARATTVDFVDDHKFWPGWSATGNNNEDNVGIPDFQGGKAVISEDGYLTSLIFDYTSDESWATSYWDVLSPGDLFIDIGANANWDYVVKLFNIANLNDNNSDNDAPGPYNSDPGPGQYDLYQINQGLNDSGYTLSGKDGTDSWRGYGIRDGHPVAFDVDADQFVRDIYFDGWKTLDDPGDPLSSTFDFTYNREDGIYIGSADFTIAWTVNCANDVVYETIPNPVPEPATMLLLGTGLIGLAGLGRRMFCKN